jgi:hypothetical protein
MASKRWAAVGRLSLAILACTFCIFPSIIFLEFTPVFDRTVLKLIDVASFHVPIEVSLSFVRLATIFVGSAIWMLPSAFAVGFAVRSTVRSRFSWGLSLSYLLTCVYLWLVQIPGEPVASRVVALIVLALVVSERVFSLTSHHSARLQNATIGVASFLLTVPVWIALFHAPAEPPEAEKVWSVALEKNAWQGMNTDSEYESRRQVIFAGNRLIVSFDAGSAAYQNQQPMSNYRLLSLDVQTGAVKNSKEFIGKWGSMPLLYLTNDGHVILQHESLKSLNPDLSETGSHFAPDKGRVSQMSPDGSTMAWETMPGSTLVDSDSLTPLPQHFDESNPTSVSKHAVLTDNLYWYGKYPNDHAFVTLTDETGKHLIYHGKCGSRPEFLSDEKILVIGCHELIVIDSQGNRLHETANSEDYLTFAGVSQNGKRFAIETNDARGDPAELLYEHFIIYDAETGQPIAMVRISDLPERISWSALSSDGHLFAAGNPNNLTLYRIP